MKNKILLPIIMLTTIFVSCRSGNIGAIRNYSNLEVFDLWYEITEIYHGKEYDETDLFSKLEAFHKSFMNKFVYSTPIYAEEQAILDENAETIKIIINDMEYLKKNGFNEVQSDSLVGDIDYRMYFLENWYFWMESEMNTRYIIFYILLIITTVLTVGILIYLNNRELNKMNRKLTQSKDTLKHIIKVQEEERTRISRELHDSLAQNIRIMGFLASQIDNEKIATEIQEKQTDCINEIRSLCYNFAPPDIRVGDLTSALKTLVSEFINQSGIECRLTMLDGIDFSVFTTEELMHFYRIIQESLSNIQKHSKATEATILFRYEKEEAGTTLYKLIISDDGCGIGKDILVSLKANRFPKKKIDGTHFGLGSIKDRTDILDGKLRIESMPEEGTQIIVSVRR